MSKLDTDSDGFQIVKTRNSKNKRTIIPRKNLKNREEDPIIDIDKSKKRIYSALEDLENSEYLKSVLEAVSTILDGKTLVEIVCFGLGHLAECNISRYQLALLLALKKSFCPVKVLVYDPIFYKAECSILQQLGFVVIEKNSEGGYIISDKGISILYLPHCPKQLTNNFLWSNWGQELHNCVLICNSFSSLFENQLERVLNETVPYIYKLFPHAVEITLENTFKFADIFNDTSIHTFPQVKLNSLDTKFWLKGGKPDYKDSEEFITSLMIEKLNI